MLLLLRSTSDGESEAFGKKDAKIVAVVSGIACVVGLIITIIFYIMVKEPGQCLLNKNKRRLALANSILNGDRTTEQASKPTTQSIVLPETLNNKVVGSTENSDYTIGVYKQTSTNDITPYYYPAFHYCPAATSSSSPVQQQTPETPAVPITPIKAIPPSLVERPKLMSSISIDTTASDLAESNGKNLYRKKGEQLEKKKSKLSLRSMAPIKRMFSVDARKQFNCKGDFDLP